MKISLDQIEPIFIYILQNCVILNHDSQGNHLRIKLKVVTINVTWKY